jgi:hypothetical protein
VWLVLCSAYDIPALWAYQGLRARGLAPVELVSAELLTNTLRWEHRLGSAGVSINISLADGRVIRGDRVRGTLNRLLSLPFEYFQMASPVDRQYATQEMNAFFMSWLYALPAPVLNRPTPQGLCGHWRHPVEWHILAAKAGLPTAVCRQSSFDTLATSYPGSQPATTLFAVQDRIVGGPAPGFIVEGCRRLAELSGTAVLGIDFRHSPEGPWTFAGCTPMPDLRLGGAAILDALADTLRQRNN